MVTEDVLDPPLDDPARAVSGLLQQLLGGMLSDELAMMLAQRLLGAFTGSPAQPAADKDLAERNIVLASALGACDCWGERPDCDVCGGAGAAGWTSPDRAAFDLYVAPALRTVDRSTAEGAGS
ncbi:hypothetical protein [Actinoplanes auranticolor]|uniref:Uncharacterized protein n=1 Tax=Actinoplanes auranticolor TaxID=47988 RepID=A0A919SSR9_9ACTN|nr:hypothetical protein [Actinoplanes auranticolor]GIM76373.1 hypothetical protein Aau02nite_70530 [Actinoplanes auranticolor]